VYGQQSPTVSKSQVSSLPGPHWGFCPVTPSTVKTQ